MKTFTLLMCLALSLSVTYGQHEHHRVQVDVYYESLCPDSIKFITTQLHPALQGNLSEFINLNLVPYGRSTDSFVANEYQFTCRHGVKECEENKYHLCALKLTNGGRPTPGLGYNKVAFGFISCLMRDTVNKKNDTVFPTTECATSNNVTNLATIENCAGHSDSSNYLSMAGQTTKNLSPPLTSVPRIVFNGQYKDSDDKMAQQNFVKAICHYIEHDKPSECSGNSAVVPTIATAFLLLSVLCNLF